MALQSIGLGVAPSGAGGDAARTAFEKINANFSNPAHAASRMVQASPADTSPGALMAVGAFGLGADAMPPRNDLNTLTTAGMYQFNSPTSGFPGFNYGAVLVLARHTSEVVQIAWDITSETQVSRKLIGGTWSPWRATYHAGNILGTVSQLNGVPTGALFEYGSNANGEYLRLPDGTQICSFRSALLSGDGGVKQVVWTFPAPFVRAPVISPSWDIVENFAYISGHQTLSGNATYLFHQAAAGVTGYLTATARGRWY